MKKMLLMALGMILAGAAISTGENDAAFHGLGVQTGFWDADELGSGVGAGVRYERSLAKIPALGLQVGGSYFSVFEKYGYRADIGAVEAGLFIRKGETVKTYLGAGAGYYFFLNEGEENGDVIPLQESGLQEPGASTFKIKNAFGFYLAGGLSCPMTRRLSLFIEARYIALNTDITQSVLWDDWDSTWSSDLTLSGLGANIGLVRTF